MLSHKYLWGAGNLNNIYENIYLENSTERSITAVDDILCCYIFIYFFKQLMTFVFFKSVSSSQMFAFYIIRSLVLFVEGNREVCINEIRLWNCLMKSAYFTSSAVVF